MKPFTTFNPTQELEIGGVSKELLLQCLENRGILLNDYAKTLFSNEKFLCSNDSYRVTIKSLTLIDLGLLQGGTTEEIYRKADQAGLTICPLELAPHLRLHYTDQKEGHYLTVASRKLEDDEDYPNGFYLRVIENQQWLRGYRADSDYLWDKESTFVFMLNKST